MKPSQQPSPSLLSRWALERAERMRRGRRLGADHTIDFAAIAGQDRLHGLPAKESGN